MNLVNATHKPTTWTKQGRTESRLHTMRKVTGAARLMRLIEGQG